MKTRLIVIIVCTLTFLSFRSVSATHQSFLPIVAHDLSPVDFRLEHIRLWDIYENGGTPSTPIDCGHGGRVQVHVFDHRGDVGMAARVDNAAVQVVYYIAGQRYQHYFLTGSGAAGPGVAEFPIDGSAEIRLVYDANGQPVTSPTASVTSDLRDLSPDQMESALYCDDGSRCAALTASNSCAGGMSWSLVFVRNH